MEVVRQGILVPEAVQRRAWVLRREERRKAEEGIRLAGDRAHPRGMAVDHRGKVVLDRARTLLVEQDRQRILVGRRRRGSSRTLEAEGSPRGHPN